MSKFKVSAVLLAALCVFQVCDSVEDTGSISDLEAGERKFTEDKNTPVKLWRPDGERMDEPSLASQTTKASQKELAFDKLYAEGIKAYDSSLWYACANKLELAIAAYKHYKQVLTDCRLDCSKGLRTTKMSNVSSSLADFESFAKFLRDADCFRRCKDESLATDPIITDRLEEAFEKRIPYQYLQFCYFKLDRIKQAASASYTFYLSNTEDVDSKQNMMYYREKVADSDFVNLELVPYKEHYIKAMLAYQDGDWKYVISEIEASLEDYFKQNEACYANCQGKIKLKGTEFITAVADLMINVLICKLDCEEKLSIVYSEPVNYFLQDMYHYLQFTYYKEHELEKAAEATASFLALNSSYIVMKENKEILKNKLGYTDDDFVPRKEVEEYAIIRREMQDLMDYINKNYRWPDLIEEHEPDEDILDALNRMEEHNENNYREDWMTRYEKLGMHLIAKSTDLKREDRFVTDGLLKAEECEELLTLVKDLKTEEIGSLKFDLKVAQRELESHPDEEYETSLRLFVRAAEIVRHYTQRYLDSDETLYLKYTSIVCWSRYAEPDFLKNCYPQEDGACIKFHQMSDALFSDGFTTITYLNTVDEDGDFQFLNEKQQIDGSFGVKCGRTVGFNSGDRHTLKLPKEETQRCAMVIRFTNYHSDDEKDYRDTIALLHRVDELRFASAINSAQEVLKNFEKQGVKIVKQGKELMGKERFVADGLATDAQCSTLRNMIQELGKAGDGYNGKISPHTVNEMFAGLSLVQVSQSGALGGDGYDHLSSKPSFISPHTEHERYQGITIYRAAKLTLQGMISTFGLQAFLELSENSRLLVEKFFNLTKPLYFDYTHLVCRTAIDDSKVKRQDLSHPVHADNCILQPNGSCTKDYPAFTQRDYSAILYMNADFEGGEFFFAHANKSEQVSIRPKCGRLVGFSAGDFHGVKAVKSGQRCALALWFTHNANFKELAHIQARKVLKQMEDVTKAGQKQIHEDL